MANNNTPIAVNYTNRDFYSLRDDLISRVQARLADSNSGKQWTATDASDFGVALVEAFAYVGDLTSYYIDRVANEGYLATATQRKSLLDLAALFGYTPAGYRQSSLILSFSNSDTTKSVVVPMGSEWSVDLVDSQGTTQLLFTLAEDVSIPAAVDGNTPGTATGLAFHGYSTDSTNPATNDLPNDINGELLGYSDGSANQTFELEINHVVDGSVHVYVHDGVQFNEWQLVTHITDYSASESVFTLASDEDNYVSVTFGDGVSGAIPTLGSAIKTVYTVGGGLVGNIEGGKAFTLHYVPSSSGQTVTDLVTVSAYTNGSDSATGGEDPESNDSLRINAPAALRTLNRAVTLDDFHSLALSVLNVGKAYAVAQQPNSVALYIAPTTSDASQDYFPGFDGANLAVTSSWYDLKASVVSYFADKTQIGTTLTVLPPTYIPVTAAIQYTKQDTYSHDQIINAIKYTLVYEFGFNGLDFNTVIRPEQVESALSQIPGVISLKAVGLYRSASSAARTTLIPTNGEYFVFRDQSVSAYPTASLSNLVASSGTFSPLFKTQSFTYALNGVSTSSITLTPTVWDSTDTITINGTVVASGSASGSISTPTGTTSISIVVTSSDGLSKNTYSITVIR